MITKEILQLALPTNKNTTELVPYFETYMSKYGINSKSRIASFLAQLGHESLDLTVLRENLNYKAERLNQVFPKYFPTPSAAAPYDRSPQKIANKVYGNRMGNGNEESGDGYKFRGRGGFQLTGKNNYSAFAQYLNKPLDEVVVYLETTEGAIESACWYWNTRNLNVVADKQDTTTITKIINGGNIGLADRKARFNKILEALANLK